MTPEACLLDRDRIAGAGVIGRHIVVFRETGSTNDVVAHAAAGGEPEGFVAFAEAQTSGRGQYGRKWASANGLGLWFSVLLRPRWPSAAFPEVTPLVAVAVARALSEVADVTIQIKPPNDIFCRRRKLAGILSEAKAGRENHVVVGIGVNVNHEAGHFPLELQTTATSLRVETGQSWDRERVASAILAKLGESYDPDGPPGEDIAGAYAALSHGLVCDSFAE